ncbi:MAG: hypothetical protein AAGA77_24845 [Bacteroidota bacterium]
MKVSLINEFKDKFKTYLTEGGDSSNAFYFEIIHNWQNHWNIEGKALHKIYDASLQSKISARLWGGSVNSPKSMMMILLQREEEFMRATFRDLFKEALDLGLRLDRFGFHTDQVFKPLQSEDKRHVSHLHHDREILCLYLSLEYPDRYCLFNYPAFQKMMQLFESRNIPTKVEVERYYKSCRGIKNLLMKDEEFVELFKDRYQLDADYSMGLMIMSVFMEFIAS